MTGVRSLGLLERETESAAIESAVKAAEQGHGGVLLVEGPAGIGKTRLLAEARTVAAETGLTVARARASELERDFAFGTVRQLFEPLLTRADPTARDSLWEGPAAQAKEVFTAATTMTTTAEPTGDFAVLHGLYWLSVNTSRNQPLLLLLDDLQWCDTPSLRYLAYLLPRVEDLPVLVMAALRTGETGTDQRLLEQIITDPIVQVLRPHPLSAHATSLLLEQTLPAVDEGFAAACHQAAGGNPLLLRELARTVSAGGLAATTGNAARVNDLGPRAVDRLVAARLAHLPHECNVLARAVAVLGDHTDLTTAAALARQDIPTALAATAALERVEILHARQHNDRPTLSFVHPLIRTTVYQFENLAHRVAAHRHAARLLLEDTRADPEQVAAHLLRVTPAEDRETVAVLRAAAGQASRHGSPQAAVTYLERALREPPTDAELPAILEETGRVAEAVDNHTAARHLEKALKLAHEPLDPILVI